MGYEEVFAELDELGSGKFMKFKKVGDKFEGYYVKDEPGQYGDDFTFRRADGSNCVITANLKDLKKKLAVAKENGLKTGHMVAILFSDQKPSGDFKVNIFKVMVNKTPKVPMPKSSEPEDPFDSDSDDTEENPF